MNIFLSEMSLAIFITVFYNPTIFLQFKIKNYLKMLADKVWHTFYIVLSLMLQHYTEKYTRVAKILADDE